MAAGAKLRGGQLFDSRRTSQGPADPPGCITVAEDNGVFARLLRPVGFDGDSTHVGGALCLAPDGSMLDWRGR